MRSAQEAVQAARDAGETMAEIARRSGIDRGQLTNWLAGRCGIGIEKLADLCGLFPGTTLEATVREQRRRRDGDDDTSGASSHATMTREVAP